MWDKVLLPPTFEFFPLRSYIVSPHDGEMYKVCRSWIDNLGTLHRYFHPPSKQFRTLDNKLNHSWHREFSEEAVFPNVHTHPPPEVFSIYEEKQHLHILYQDTSTSIQFLPWHEFCSMFGCISGKRNDGMEVWQNRHLWGNNFF